MGEYNIMVGLAGKIGRRIAENLFLRHQVIAKSVTLSQNKTTLEVFRNGTKLEIRTKVVQGKCYLKSTGSWKLVEKGTFLRLGFQKENSIDSNISSSGLKSQSKIDLVKQYLSTNVIRGSFRVALIMGYLISTKCKQLGRNSGNTGANNNLRLEQIGGITFEVMKTKPCVELRCCDFGGIYIDSFDGEGNYFPPQVNAQYYATEYAAACFLQESKKCAKSDKRKWETAYKDALGFANLFYENYPFAKIVFNSVDFKNVALLDLQHIGNSGHVRTGNVQLPEKLCEANYSPVNIAAVRLCWYVLDSTHNHTSAIKRQIRILKSNQTTDGLIQDNYSGMILNAKDLSYHAFACGFLARAFGKCQSGSLKKQIWFVLKKACEYSMLAAGSDSDAIYYGRGANNYYHMATLAYALRVYHLESPRAAASYLADELVSKISKGQNRQGFIPAGANSFGLTRMGWNHNAITYNALIGYFLYHIETMTTVRSRTKRAQKTVPVNQVKTVFLPKSGFLRIVNDNYEATFISGSDCYRWSGNVHATGTCGLAKLYSRTRGEDLLGCLDYLPDKGVSASDIPCFSINGKTLLPFESKLNFVSQSHSKSAIIQIRHSYFDFERSYVCQKSGVLVKSKLIIRKKVRLGVDGFFKIAQLKKIAGKRVDFSLTHKLRSKIVSNPKGEVKLLCYDGFSQNFKRGDCIEGEYFLTL